MDASHAESPLCQTKPKTRNTIVLEAELPTTTPCSTTAPPPAHHRSTTTRSTAIAPPTLHTTTHSTSSAPPPHRYRTTISPSPHHTPLPPPQCRYHQNLEHPGARQQRGRLRQANGIRHISSRVSLVMWVDTRLEQAIIRQRKDLDV